MRKLVLTPRQVPPTLSHVHCRGGYGWLMPMAIGILTGFLRPVLAGSFLLPSVVALVGCSVPKEGGTHAPSAVSTSSGQRAPASQTRVGQGQSSPATSPLSNGEKPSSASSHSPWSPAPARRGLAVGEQSPPGPRAAVSPQPHERELPELPGLPEAAELPQDAEKTAAQLRQEALEVADELAASLPKDCGALAVRGWVYHRLGKTSEASRCWTACLKLDPRFAEAHFQLGSAAVKAGRFAEAQNHFQHAVDSDPKRTDARLRLAESLLMQGKAPEAVAVLEPLLAESGPVGAEAQYFTGRACLLLRHYAQAQRHFEEAIRLAPEMTHAYHGLATALARQGQSESARRYQAEFERRKQQDQKAEKERLKALDDVAELRTAVARAHAAAAGVFRAQGWLALAERHWRRAASLDAGDSDCRLQLVMLYQQQGRLADALRWCEELLQRQPRNPVFLLHTGLLYAEMHRWETAERMLRRALEAAPEHAAAHAALAQLYLRTGRNLDQARHHARRATQLADTAANNALLAAVCQAQGDRAAARQAIQRALHLEPDNAQIRAFEQSLGPETK